MSYTSYKPWVGKNYHLQNDKIMIFLPSFMTLKPKTCIRVENYASPIENSLIAYVDDFVNYQLENDDGHLAFLSEMLAMQKIDDINRAELWSNYACYLPYVMDNTNQTLLRKANDWVRQDFFNTLDKLQPNKIIVGASSLFVELPTPDNVIKYRIQEKRFEITFENVVYNQRIVGPDSTINEYIINGQSIYAVEMVHFALQKYGGCSRFTFLGARHKLERYFDTIHELEKKK